MTQTTTEILHLKRQVARLQVGMIILAAGATAVLVGGAVANAPVSEEIRARRIAVVDDNGVERIVLGQDAEARRHGRSAALWIYDRTGAERGGFGTFENGQASLAIDAPEGVGVSPRDRLGLRVTETGEASIMVLNNDTGVPVRMIADGDHGGGLEFLECRRAEQIIRIRRLAADGESTRDVSHPCGGGAQAPGGESARP